MSAEYKAKRGISFTENGGFYCIRVPHGTPRDQLAALTDKVGVAGNVYHRAVVQQEGRGFQVAHTPWSKRVGSLVDMRGDDTFGWVRIREGEEGAFSLMMGPLPRLGASAMYGSGGGAAGRAGAAADALAYSGAFSSAEGDAALTAMMFSDAGTFWDVSQFVAPLELVARLLRGIDDPYVAEVVRYLEKLVAIAKAVPVSPGAKLPERHVVYDAVLRQLGAFLARLGLVDGIGLLGAESPTSRTAWRACGASGGARRPWRRAASSASRSRCTPARP